MSLKHILLGMLAKPASGYELKGRFAGSLRYFWSAELAQLYPTLHRMEREELVSSETQPSEQGPPKRVYSRTEEGRRLLLEWLSSGPVVGTERLAYLAQVFFLDALEDTTVAQSFFAELEAHFVGLAEELDAIHKGWSADDPRYPDALPDRDFYAQLTLDLGRRKYAAILEWIRASQRRLARRASLSH